VALTLIYLMFVKLLDPVGVPVGRPEHYRARA
jgi:hypothetical protein